VIGRVKKRPDRSHRVDFRGEHSRVGGGTNKLVKSRGKREFLGVLTCYNEGQRGSCGWERKAREGRSG